MSTSSTPPAILVGNWAATTSVALHPGGSGKLPPAAHITLIARDTLKEFYTLGGHPTPCVRQLFKSKPEDGHRPLDICIVLFDRVRTTERERRSRHTAWFEDGPVGTRIIEPG